MQLQKVKKIDIITIANKYLSLKKSGNLYKTLCPFHTDKDSPSLIFYPNTNTFKCYGCGKSGSNIDFIMTKENLSFHSAYKFIVEQFSTIDIVNIIKPKLIKIPKIVPPTNIKYWFDYLLETPKRLNYFLGRGLNTITVMREMLGWTGDRYTIPIWSAKPQFSNVVGTRFRKSEFSPKNAPKYIGIKNNNNPGFWGKFYTTFKDYMFMFAGELDAMLAVQDGLPACSLINGMNSFRALPRNWPIIDFPNVKNLLVLFDKGEELEASQVLNHWNRVKGGRFGDVLQWPFKSLKDEKDYTDFRKIYNIETILKNLQKQTEVCLL